MTVTVEGFRTEVAAFQTDIRTIAAEQVENIANAATRDVLVVVLASAYRHATRVLNWCGPEAQADYLTLIAAANAQAIDNLAPSLDEQIAAIRAASP